jgi:hypothetical protein
MTKTKGVRKCNVLAFVYSAKLSIISGALYHLVATYSVWKPAATLSGSLLKPRARPKSQIFNSQSALTSRLPGLVDEGLEVGVGQGLATADDGGQITLHQLLVQVDLVVAAGTAGDVHVEETCDLDRRQLAADRQTRVERERLTLRWPLKCCNSLISRRARLARICLLKTFVIFLTATCSFGS